MADAPVFQGHHVIEQQAFRDSKLLQALSRQELFDLDGSRNMLNLPADKGLADRIGVSPHTGGPLGDYSQEIRRQLNELQASPDGQAVLRGDQAPAQRIAARVNTLTDTLKTGLINDDLVTNTPQGMTTEQANVTVRTFFADLDGYQRTHATHIAEIGTMTPSEARWGPVTQFERNVRTTLNTLNQSGKPARSKRWGRHHITPIFAYRIGYLKQAGSTLLHTDQEKIRHGRPDSYPRHVSRRGSEGEVLHHSA